MHRLGVASYVCGWLVLLGFYTVGLRETAAPSYLLAWVYAATYLSPGAVISLLALWLMGRIRWEAIKGGTFAMLQATILLGQVLVWNLCFFGYLYLAGGPAAVQETARRGALGWEVTFQFFIAAIQAAVFHALRVFGELQAKELAAVEAHRLRERAEMEALRGQLNPHFLFNSLHSITALVREDPPRAEEALLQFSALLRRVLEAKRDSADEVPLAEELAFIDAYLAVERLRLGDRLNFAREVSPAALACWIPAFTLQPLVENAIRHALAPRREGGRLVVSAVVTEGRLVIEVQDDGAGAEPAAVAASTGVGLGVVRRRLALRHGGEGGLEVRTSPGEGFRVRIALPAVDGPLMEATA